MGRGLAPLAWRFLRARKLRTTLSAFSVILGVGLLAALLTLNASMSQAVDAHIIQKFGDFDMMVGYRKAGLRLSEAELAEIAGLPGVTNVAGVIIPYMYEPADLRGLSYYGAPNTPLGQQFMGTGKGAPPGPGEVLVSASWANREGVKVGDMVRLPFPPHPEREVRISGIIPAPKGAGLALFDRSWLEGASGRQGSTFVLMETVPAMNLNQVVGAAQERFPDLDYDLRKAVDDIRKNLNALRPVALGMGVALLLACGFLLTASFRMSLAERTQELALLRAVGATPGQVRRLVLLEGLLIGVGGSIAGAMLGVPGALFANSAMARMMDVDPVAPVIPFGSVAVLAGVGALVALLSAWGVAKAASRTEPLRAMRPDLPAQEQSARRGGVFGLALAGLGIVLVAVTRLMPEDVLGGGLPALTGSTGALFIALGLLLGVQRLLPWLLPALALPFRGRPEQTIAVRSLLRHRQQSGLTMGVLGLALILVIAIGTFATSLLGRWQADVRKQHPADIQLEVPCCIHRGVPADLAEVVGQIPGVTQVGRIYDQSSVMLVGHDWTKADPDWLKAMNELDKRFGSRVLQQNILWVSPGDLPKLLAMGVYRLEEGTVQSWKEGDLAISKRDAQQRGFKLGDKVQLNMNQDLPHKAAESPVIRTFTIVAMVENDSWKLPHVLISTPLPGSSERLSALFANTSPQQRDSARLRAKELVQSMAYNLAEYSDVDTATAELQAATNQRFALLLAVVVIMAIVGTMSLLNTVVNSVNERRREFALLRSVGATPFQVRNQVLLEAGLLGLAGGVVGVVGGAVLGAGALWGLEASWGNIHLPWALMGLAVLVSMALGLLAAFSSARRVMKTAPAEALRV